MKEIATSRLSSIKVILLTAVCIAGSSACSKGYNRDLLSTNLNREGIQITDDEIKKIEALRPQLPVKCTVGVYANGSLRFKKILGDALSPIAEKLVKEGVVKDMPFIDDDRLMNSGTHDSAAIRELAATYGVDAVAIIDSATEYDQYVNPLSVFYLTVVGLWIVPGSEVNALSMLRAQVRDVHNGFLYAVARGEGEANLVRPRIYLEKQDAERKAWEKAASDLAPDFETRMRNLALQAARQH